VPDTLASIHLYRIAQEAVSNALKHGKATVIVIRLKRKNGDIILSVADNGTGMPQGMSDHDGMGLRIMSYRAKLIGGDLTIQPRPKSKGTLVECRVPRRPSQGGIHHAN
jgi:signal transduction histidine kinase